MEPSIVRNFGKKANSADFGYILMEERPPISCRILERTLRVVRLSVEGYKELSREFTLIYQNGSENLLCQIIAHSDDGIVARYSSKNRGRGQLDIIDNSISLDDVERWRG